jgi:hypothetical protein
VYVYVCVCVCCVCVCVCVCVCASLYVYVYMCVSICERLCESVARRAVVAPIYLANVRRLEGPCGAERKQWGYVQEQKAAQAARLYEQCESSV